LGLQSLLSMNAELLNQTCQYPKKDL